MTDRPEPLLVSIQEAARLLNYSVRTLERMHAAGKLAIARPGKRRRVPMSEVRRLTLAVVRQSATGTDNAVAGSVTGDVSGSGEETKETQRVAS